MKIGKHATQKIITNKLSEVNKDRKNNPVTSFPVFIIRENFVNKFISDNKFFIANDSYYYNPKLFFSCAIGNTSHDQISPDETGGYWRIYP